MNSVLLLACIGMITGLFVLLRITPYDLTKGVISELQKQPRSLKKYLDESTNRKKESYVKRELKEMKNILEVTGRAHLFSSLTALSLFLFMIGGSIAIIIGNWFLLPVLACGFMLIPFWYVRMTQAHFKKQISNELETALSIITTAYLRTENIVIAIEENVEYLREPIVSVFQNFLYRLKVVDPDMVSALEDMKQKIDHPVFHEWISTVIQCQNNRNLKSTLTPITMKLSDMRVVNAELETLVNGPRQEFLAMVAFVICNIPLLYFLNINWYNALMYTVPGQMVLAVCGIAIFVSITQVIHLTQPIEYRR